MPGGRPRGSTAKHKAIQAQSLYILRRLIAWDDTPAATYHWTELRCITDSARDLIAYYNGSSEGNAS